jgi:DNA-binding YbaB/EbfC family protein
MNIQKMMKQAQQMQQKIALAQSEVEQREAEGQAGSGAVKITLKGNGEMLKINIDAAVCNADDREMLEDLIIAAHRDAKQKIDAIVSDTMGNATSGLNLPAGIKLPF